MAPVPDDFFRSCDHLVPITCPRDHPDCLFIVFTMIVAAHNAADSGALISRAHASVVSAPTVSGCSGGVDGDMAAHRSVCLVGAASRLARSFQAGRLARLAGSPKLPYLMRAPRSRALWPRSTLSSSASALLCSAALSPTCTCHSSHRDNHLSFTLSSLPPSLFPSPPTTLGRTQAQLILPPFHQQPFDSHTASTTPRPPKARCPGEPPDCERRFTTRTASCP